MKPLFPYSSDLVIAKMVELQLSNVHLRISYAELLSSKNGLIPPPTVLLLCFRKIS